MSYRIQNCCRNCRYVFDNSDYDYEEYYCNREGEAPPVCGFYSSLMPRAEVEKRLKAWEDWAKDREVVREGICDLWEIREKGVNND